MHKFCVGGANMGYLKRGGGGGGGLPPGHSVMYHVLL